MNRRYWYILNLYFIRSPLKRAEYMKKKRIFHSMGSRVMITSRKIPLYARLISIGNNVWIASGVEFISHDVTHYMLNGIKDGHKYMEKIGCIEIGDNVFIGAGTKILYNVKVGNNVIVGAGSLINKDVPANSVVAGIPARVVTTFEKYLAKRKEFYVRHPANNMNQEISPECEKEMWEMFYKERMKVNGF